MKLKIYLLLVFGSLFFCVNAQEQVLKGIVINASTDEGIEGATVDILDSEKGAITSKEGLFELSIDANFPFIIRISYLGFEAQEIVIENNEEEVIVRLQASMMELPEIVVSSKRKIDTVFQEPYSIADYFFKGDDLLLLAYRNSKEKYALILLDSLEETVHMVSLTDKKVSKIHETCDGDLFLITHFHAYEIQIKADSLQLGERFHLEEFPDYLEPCVLATEKNHYFSRDFFQGQALQFYASPNSNDSLKVALPRIEHVQNIDLLIEDMGLKMPYSGDVWQENVSDELKKLRERPYLLKGVLSIFYPKLSAPIIQKDSAIVIFDYYKSSLLYLSEAADTLQIVPINFHDNRKWKKDIYFDESKQKAYTSFNTRWGESIRQINLETGELFETEIPLDKAFVEKVKVYNGYLYFLYRNTTAESRNRILHKMYIE